MTLAACTMEVMNVTRVGSSISLLDLETFVRHIERACGGTNLGIHIHVDLIFGSDVSKYNEVLGILLAGSGSKVAMEMLGMSSQNRGKQREVAVLMHYKGIDSINMQKWLTKVEEKKNTDDTKSLGNMKSLNITETSAPSTTFLNVTPTDQQRSDSIPSERFFDVQLPVDHKKVDGKPI